MSRELEFNDESDEEHLSKSFEAAVAGTLKHTAQIRCDMGSEYVSDLICRVLSVDKEPARSKATRYLSTSQNFLVANFISTDRKYLQKSMDNFMEMCDLASQTFQVVGKYKIDNLQDLEKVKPMFKGLKTKIEDEAKRLQATVSHYGENIAQQVRSSANEAGSEISGHARKFFSPPTPDDKIKNASKTDNFKTSFSESGFSLEDDMVDEGHRSRHGSGNSIGSNESTLSEFFSSIPGMISSNRRFDALSSDVEGESVAGSEIYKNASKEQISSVLHKLQGRAATYKDKYRELVKVYNELIKDNEKYKNLLVSTQDKTIKRVNALKSDNKLLLQKLKAMEGSLKNEASLVSNTTASSENIKIRKLEELLEKCKLSINEYKQNNAQLNEENNRLKKLAEGASDEQGISDFAMQRINAEWKGKMDALEAEYTKKIHDTEEKCYTGSITYCYRATLLVAQVKADMHAALEEKENEVQEIRSSYKKLKAEGDENERQKAEFQSTIDALEAEKADMVNKLSEAKQKGVLVVREEEERKRKELEVALEEREKQYQSRCQQHFEEQKKNLVIIYSSFIEEQWNAKFKEVEEQMQLAVEEREMQSIASSAEQSRKIEELQNVVEQLTTEKLQLSLKKDSLKERYETEVQGLNDRMGKTVEGHKAEVANLIKEHDEMVNIMKKESDAVKCTNERLKDELRTVNEQYEKKIKLMIKEHEDNVEKILSKKKVVEKDNKQLNERFMKTKKELKEVTKARDVLSEKLKTSETLFEDFKKEHVLYEEEMNSHNRQLEKFTENSSEQIKAITSELDQLKEILKEKSDCICQLQKEKEALVMELASTRKSSAMKHQLDEQANNNKNERSEAKKQMLIQEHEVESLTAEPTIDSCGTAMNGRPHSLCDCKEDTNPLDISDAAEVLDSTVPLVLLAGSEDSALVQEQVGEFNESTIQESAQELQTETLTNKQKLDGRDGFDRSEKAPLNTKMIEELRKQLSVANDRCRVLSDELHNEQQHFRLTEEELKNEITNLQKLLLEKSEELNESSKKEICSAQFASENDELRQKLASMEKLADDLEIQVLSIKEELSEKSRSYELYDVNKEKIIGMMKEFSSNFVKLLDDLSQKISVLNEQESRLNELSLMVENCSKSVLGGYLCRISKLESKVGDLEKNVEEKDVENNNLMTRLNVLLEEAKRKELESDELKSSANNLKEENKALKLEMELLKESVTQIREQLNAECCKKEEFQKNMTEMEKEVNGLKANENEIKDHYDNIARDYENRLKLAEKDVEMLESVLAEKKELEKKFLETKETNEENLEMLKKVKHEAEESLNKKVAELNEEKNTEIKKIEETLASEIASLKTELDERQTECSKLQDKVQSLQKDISELKTETDAAADELSRNLKEAIGEKNLLVEKLKSVEHEARELRVSNAENESLLDKKSSEVIELEKLTKKANERNLQLTEKTKSLEELNSHLQQKNEELERGAKEFEERLEKLFHVFLLLTEQTKNDRQRVMNEVQKEIKRLYAELNERNKSLEEANVAIAELKKNLLSVKDGQKPQVENEDSLNICDFDVSEINYEEIQLLKEQVKQYKQEIAALKDKNSSILQNPQSIGEQKHVPHSTLSFSEDEEHKNQLPLHIDDTMKDGKYPDNLSPRFADPAEAEYLRYVLFRYMSERENLGKESVTLAKVIATVAKFSREQLEVVVAKEEQRTNPLFRPIF
uniref:GRIP domain-containing protein n=1 Tax=Syphacia muris TaxID=451379 RepID=A0A158R3Z1_9BILA